MNHENIEAALKLLAGAIQGAGASTGHHTGDLVKQVHDVLHPEPDETSVTESEAPSKPKGPMYVPPEPS